MEMGVVNFQAAPDRKHRRSLQSPVALGIPIGAELATSTSGSPWLEWFPI